MWVTKRPNEALLLALGWTVLVKYCGWQGRRFSVLTTLLPICRDNHTAIMFTGNKWKSQRLWGQSAANLRETITLLPGKREGRHCTDAQLTRSL